MKRYKETMNILEELMRTHQPGKPENQMKYYLKHMAETGRVGECYLKLRACCSISRGLLNTFFCIITKKKAKSNFT